MLAGARRRPAIKNTVRDKGPPSDISAAVDRANNNGHPFVWPLGQFIDEISVYGTEGDNRVIRVVRGNPPQRKPIRFALRNRRLIKLEVGLP